MRAPRLPLGTDREAALALRLGGPVAGIDEAGRGPWAGPVIAAAVVLDPATAPPGLADSKLLAPAQRAVLFEALMATARVGVGRAEVAEIDRVNILRATDLAMARALAALAGSGAIGAVLVDGNRVPPRLGLPAEALVGGDGLAASVAAASIVAKVTRDRIMAALAEAHPGYGWERNMGYGTTEHREALARLGVSPEHRRSFRPVYHILCEDSPPTN